MNETIELSLRTYRRARVLLITSVGVLFLWNLWSYDLWAPDEPYFAEGAREMLADGQWLVPHINGALDNHKPPLFFWLIGPEGRAYSHHVGPIARQCTFEARDAYQMCSHVHQALRKSPARCRRVLCAAKSSPSAV